MPKTILVAANVYPPRFIGGAELVAHRHACIMQEAGNRVIVFAGEARPSSQRHTLVEDTYEGLTVHRVQLKAVDYNADFVSFYHPEVERHFAGLLARYEPDVVHFHNLNGLSTGLISQAARSGAVTVLTAHDYWGFCLRNTLLLRDGRICPDHSACADCQMYIQDGRIAMIPTRMRNDFLALQFRALDRLICPSAFLAAAYVESGLVPADKAVVVHNGVDLQHLSPISRESYHGPMRFAYIGHLGFHKGVLTLLEAFAQLCRDGLPAALAIVGEGDHREELQRAAATLGIAGHVQFTGKVDNRAIERTYSNIDALVIPSIWPENQPVTIMEAMATRTAVIASRIGGIPEFVEDRKSGLLFEPGNPSDLARCMREFLASPAMRQACTEYAWQRVREESYESQARRIMALYDEVGGATSRSPVPHENVVVCAGNRLDWQCADAVDRITRAAFHSSWRFVMQGWLDGDLKNAALAWITDNRLTPEQVLPLVAAHLPLLVPESNAALLQLCKTAGCGLYYRSPEDVIACLERLITDKALRTTLGNHGFQSLFE